MKKFLHLSLAFLLLLIVYLRSEDLNAQSVFIGDHLKTGVEVGINIGPNFFLGDLGGHRGTGKRFIKDLNFGLTKISKGAFVAIYPNDWFAFRIAAQVGKLQGRDDIINTDGRDELFRKQRNLDFRTNLFEAYAAMEIFPLQLMLNSEGDYNPRFMPYGVAGVGVYKYNPQGSLTDVNGVVTWYDLKPLRLEGQGMEEYPERKEYSLTQINIPLGAGMKYWITENLNVSLEILWRKSFNDYVDDVSTSYIDNDLFDKYLTPADAQLARRLSDKMYGIVNPNLTRFKPGDQRGNPKQNDSWVTTFLRFGWRFGGYGSRNSLRQMQCPVRF